MIFIFQFLEYQNLLHNNQLFQKVKVIFFLLVKVFNHLKILKFMILNSSLYYLKIINLLQSNYIVT